MKDTPPAYTMIFDGDCAMCSRLAERLRRWDGAGRLEVVASQQPGVRARFPWIHTRDYAGALQLVAPDGTTWQGAAAVEKVLDALPRGRWISWLFGIPFARLLADRVYRWVARNRFRLGCDAHCRP